jgi:hypothetical protein
MEYVYLDLGGGDRWNYWKVMCLAENIRLESPVLGRKYSVGKSGAWPKIFGWELEKVWKIFGLKLE